MWAKASSGQENQGEEEVKRIFPLSFFVSPDNRRISLT